MISICEIYLRHAYPWLISCMEYFLPFFVIKLFLCLSNYKYIIYILFVNALVKDRAS